MPKRNRKTLRNYFAQGALPAETHFSDLVDSTLNMVDDGFSRTPDNGVEITLLGQKRLMSFFGNAQVETPDWAITSNAGTRDLNFVGLDTNRKDSDTTRGENEVLTLTKEGMVGIQVPAPKYPLDVDGAIRMAGRTGSPGPSEKGCSCQKDHTLAMPPADGQWHDITGDLGGCQAFEVIAGVGLPNQYKGRYALLHALALNAFNPTGRFFNFWKFKNRIRVQSEAWYRSRGDRLKLRWLTRDETNHKYRLQIRAITDYGTGINIQFSITRLWFNPFMNWPPPRRYGGLAGYRKTISKEHCAGHVFHPETQGRTRRVQLREPAASRAGIYSGPGAAALDRLQRSRSRRDHSRTGLLCA